MANRTKKAAPKPEPESAEPVSLRRSSRSTRGSVKPLVVDLVKEMEAESDEQAQKVTPKPARRSLVRKEPTKREPVKRAANKKPIAKREPPEAKEAEADEEEEEADASARVKGEPQEQPEVDEPSRKEAEDCEHSRADSHEDCYELDEREMKEINHAFDMNRLGDNNEYLNTDGLRTAIRSLGFEPRGDEIKRLMKRYAPGRANRVNRDGFHRLMAFKFSTTPAMKGTNGSGSDEISRVFNLLDLDKTGSITLENLRSIAKELNEELSEEELHEMIAEADQDNDFMINKQEFEHIMRKTSLY